MVELPETYVLAAQLNQTLPGKTIVDAIANGSPHKFAWYSGDPTTYAERLTGKRFANANPGTGYTCGGNTEIIFDDMLLVLSTPIRYHAIGDKLPAKHQLLLSFDDGSALSCTVQMWGAMFCFKAGEDGLPEGYTVKKSPTPLEAGFDRTYFGQLLASCKQTLSAKAFLATEQRIPGLGNGVLQDILFNAKIHPKTKLNQLSDAQLETLYTQTVATLTAMTTQGGRDTERDLYGCNGGYQTILSAKTLGNPCPVCGDIPIRTAYLGGNIYFCPTCQPK